MNLNKCQFIGRVGKDPETKEISSDFRVANFSIATTEKWTDKASGEKRELTEWINCQAANKQAELVEKYVKKGDEIYVEGKFKTRSWEKDGSKQYATYIQVETIQMLGGKKDSEESAPTYESPVKPNQSVLPPTEYATQAPIEDDGDDSLPF